MMEVRNGQTVYIVSDTGHIVDAEVYLSHGMALRTITSAQFITKSRLVFEVPQVTRYNGQWRAGKDYVEIQSFKVDKPRTIDYDKTTAVVNPNEGHIGVLGWTRQAVMERLENEIRLYNRD